MATVPRILALTHMAICVNASTVGRFSHVRLL